MPRIVKVHDWINCVTASSKMCLKKYWEALLLKKNGDWMELGIVVNYPYYADLAQIFESGDCTDKGAALISAHMLHLLVKLGSQIALKLLLFLQNILVVPAVWSQMQHLSPNAVQVDKTVAELESLKKLLIIWLMCIRLWECEINHQCWDELLKWILVFRLLSLGNGFSFLHHQVNRCGDAVFSFSCSWEQPVTRRCLFLSPAAWAVYNMERSLLRMFQLQEMLLQHRADLSLPR